MLSSIGLTRVATTLVSSLAIIAVAASAAPPGARAAPAEAPAETAAPSSTQTAPTPAKTDQEVQAALIRMSSYLAALKSFELTTDTTMELVGPAGHQIEATGHAHYWAQRPNKLRIDTVNGTLSRQYIFDGKTLTLVAPDHGYYASERTPPTIQEALAFAAQSLSVELPLSDLFSWNAENSPLKQFEFGTLIGSVRLGDVEADHYLLVGKDADLELWVQKGEAPLPLKISIVDRSVASHPRFTARLSWTPDAQISDTVFAFAPAKEMKGISFRKNEKPGKEDK
ncbi:DUF2092 domain-containing protein [Xanthobacter sp. TB0139]|uniref:DUF2092 domain-containing protein n=1 Tax=Xanthobacter sp. TB0139 TaxID=3459178 RepID=UPI00403A4B40